MTTNDTRTARERAEEMAAEKFPDAPVDYTGLVRLAVKGDRRAFVVGFLARDAEPTTVTAELKKAISLLRELTEGDEPCWFDHHGGCQAHGYLELQPGELCGVADARQLIAEHEGDEA